MLARNNSTRSLIFRLVTSNATINTLFDDRDLILIRTGDSAFFAFGLDAHGSILDFRIIL
jgi:hypothetical protein